MSRAQERCFTLVFALCAMQFLPINSLAQQNDDYLKQLGDEAGELTLDRMTRENGKADDNPSRASGLAEVPVDASLGAGNKLPAGLSRQAFELMLEKNYFGSYIFYKRLGGESRVRVFQQYRKNPDPRRLRKSIMRAIKEQRGKP